MVRPIRFSVRASQTRSPADAKRRAGPARGRRGLARLGQAEVPDVSAPHQDLGPRLVGRPHRGDRSVELVEARPVRPAMASVTPERRANVGLTVDVARTRARAGPPSRSSRRAGVEQAPVTQHDPRRLPRDRKRPRVGLVGHDPVGRPRHDVGSAIASAEQVVRSGRLGHGSAVPLPRGPAQPLRSLAGNSATLWLTGGSGQMAHCGTPRELETGAATARPARCNSGRERAWDAEPPDAAHTALRTATRSWSSPTTSAGSSTSGLQHA